MLKKKKGIYEKFFKRLIDIICSLTTIILFWWLYLAIAVLVRIKLGTPVIFKQERPGKNEKIFNNDINALQKLIVEILKNSFL